MAIRSMEELRAAMKGLSTVPKPEERAGAGKYLSGKFATPQSPAKAPGITDVTVVLQNVRKLDAASLDPSMIGFIDGLSERRVIELAELFVRMRRVFCPPMGMNPKDFTNNASAVSANVTLFLERVMEGISELPEEEIE